MTDVEKALDVVRRLQEGGRRGGRWRTRKKVASSRRNILVAHRAVRGKKRKKKQLSLGLDTKA